MELKRGVPHFQQRRIIVENDSKEANYNIDYKEQEKYYGSPKVATNIMDYRSSAFQTSQIIVGDKYENSGDEMRFDQSPILTVNRSPSKNKKDKIDYLQNAYDRVIEIFRNSVHVGFDENEWQLARFKCNLLIDNFGLQLKAVKFNLKTWGKSHILEKLDRMKKDFQEDKSLPRDFREKAKDLMNKFLCLLQNEPIQYDNVKQNPQISIENLKELIYLSHKGLTATDKFQNWNFKLVSESTTQPANIEVQLNQIPLKR